MNTTLPLVNEFWRWFRHSRGQVSDAVARGDDGWLRANLTPQVRMLQERSVRPRLNWEIGPGKAKKWYLAISPVIRANLELTRFVVANAPDLLDWEFHHAKPPKAEGQYRFEMTDDSGSLIELDSSIWSYLLKVRGDRVGILLIGDGVRKVDSTMRKRIAYLVLDNLLGEERVLSLVEEAMLLDRSVVPADAPARAIHDLKLDLDMRVANR